MLTSNLQLMTIWNWGYKMKKSKNEKKVQCWQNIFHLRPILLTSSDISNEGGKMMCVTKMNSTTQKKNNFIFFKTLVPNLHGCPSRPSKGLVSRCWNPYLQHSHTHMAIIFSFTSIYHSLSKRANMNKNFKWKYRVTKTINLHKKWPWNVFDNYTNSLIFENLFTVLAVCLQNH